MASAPSGNAFAVDEHSLADEMPEADGNPPVDKPRLEAESNSDVPPARLPPRLRAKGRKSVQLHMANDATAALFAGENEEPTAVRALLINRASLNCFFDAADFGAAQIVYDVGRLHITKSGCWPRCIAKGAHCIAALLRLCRDLTEIDVHWYVEPVGEHSAVMHEWMQVASILRGLPSLRSIQLIACLLPHSFADFLVDSLPDRVVRVQTENLELATVLRKRQTPLELFEMFVDPHRQQPYIGHVLRLKSARIQLLFPLWDEPPRQHPLQDCGPLARNEHLQELHIDAEMYAEEGILRALRHLRAVNRHFKLVCYETRRVRLEERQAGWSLWNLFNLWHGPSDLEQVDEIAANAKNFAAIMSQAGFGQEGSELRIYVKDSEHWQRVCHEQAFERLRWTREGEIPWPMYSKSLPTCSLVHDNVRILIGLDPA